MKDKAEMTREELIALGWVKKQSTAVEFLEQELDKNFEIRGNSFLFDKILKQAKEMEKEKLKDAYDAGVWDVGCKAPNFDEYYKRTFKSE